jgi:sorbitol-specific phosphotransferase system component IIA
MKKLLIISSFVILAFALNAQTNNGISFIHRVTPSNLTNNHSEIDNPNLNNNPGAVFFISKTLQNGASETSHVGILYDGSTNKWTLYDENPGDKLKINSTYTVFIPPAETTYFNMLLLIPFKSLVLTTGC